MVYLVIGMHKSGTTLVAQSLHMSGVNMGYDLGEGDLDYASEKTESRAARAINRELLNLDGRYSLYGDPDHPGEMTPKAGEMIKAFVLKQEALVTDWGFKDPRTTQTYGQWKPFLPPHRLILVYRPLSQVWRHYTRGLLSGLKPLSRKSWRKGLLAIRFWMSYNHLILKYHTEMPKDSILINYDAMLKDASVFFSLEEFVGKRLIDCRSSRASDLKFHEYFWFSLHYTFCKLFRRRWIDLKLEDILDLRYLKQTTVSKDASLSNDSN